jgi:hypothetical protein
MAERLLLWAMRVGALLDWMRNVIGLIVKIVNVNVCASPR